MILLWAVVWTATALTAVSGCRSRDSKKGDKRLNRDKNHTISGATSTSKNSKHNTVSNSQSVENTKSVEAKSKDNGEKEFKKGAGKAEKRTTAQPAAAAKQRQRNNMPSTKTAKIPENPSLRGEVPSSNATMHESERKRALQQMHGERFCAKAGDTDAEHRIFVHSRELDHCRLQVGLGKLLYVS
ncbi:unnamed protein product [Caenorhabditis auriculariae]|uniref:Secreted protein n=1 Tax=Caenorhabditis auriculariae TaxID=2777116 RepID=A0A8S1HQ78_9PELO|nr:unnamed protein product [Caenorhabditis auriculariae]